MKNVLKPLVKNVLIQLGLTAAASVTAALQLFKKIFWSRCEYAYNLEWRNDENKLSLM